MIDQIENNFKHHAPQREKINTYELIRANGKLMAIVVNQNCPNSREKELAITKIEEAVMWASASIARNESKGGENSAQEETE